jgi:hypothetical protein
MNTQRHLSTAALVALLAGAAVAQPPTPTDPWVGQWEGTASLPDGESPRVVLRIVPNDDGYAGTVSGFTEGTQVRVTRMSVEGTKLEAEATVETDLGTMSVSYELSRADRLLTGVQRYAFGPHTTESPVELRKTLRSDVPQPQVEQRLDYFLGDWELAYTGGEFPPLSVGTRTARLSLTQVDDAPFLWGRVTGDLFGEPYEESWVIGYDARSNVLLFEERLSNGTELLSLGNWQSPIAISFVTSPVPWEGRQYQLRRAITVTSENAFTVTEEFSVDGGPFRRLGNGHFTRVQ